MSEKYRRCYHASGSCGPKSLLNFKNWLQETKSSYECQNCTARQRCSITLLLLSSIFTHVNACSGIMRNIWWTEISSRWTLSGVCARYRSSLSYSWRSVLRQTQKHFRRILTGIHTTQLWGHSSPWASGLQWTASALKVDTQRPSVSVTHSSLIFGSHISHIPIFYWHLFC